MSDNESAPIALMSSLPDRGTYADSVEARLDQLRDIETAVNEMAPAAAPQLPALDTPEALRYAAKVAHARGLSSSAEKMDGMAYRQERAATALRADAEREERIEKLAGALFGLVIPPLPGCQRDRRYDLAADLDDLGYRLDPTQAKADQ